MANIKSQSPVRYNIDNLNSALSGLVISDDYALDCSNADSVEGFSVNASTPNGTKINFLFKLDGQWGRFSSTGNFEAVSISTPDLELLQEFGNSPDELNALKNIPQLAGKRFAAAAALSADDPANAIPSFSLAVKCSSNSQILQTTQYSPVYKFNSSQIAGISPEISQTGAGSVDISVQFTDEKGVKSSWVKPENVIGKKINALQIKADFKVDAAGSSSSAALENAKIIYAAGSANGNNISEIVSLTNNWYMQIKSCRLNVKHSPLTNSKIRAFASFRNTPKIFRGFQLGIGTGSRKNFALPAYSGIKYDSVRLYFDSVRVYTGYEVNTEANVIICSAPDGTLITCDFEYGWEKEIWREMTLEKTTSFMDYDTSEYRISLPDNSLSVCAVKLSLETSTGRIQAEIIGKGAGKTQTYKLARAVNNGELDIFSNGAKLAKSAWLLNENTQYVRAAAPKNAQLVASYSWISETPSVYQMAAVFYD